MALQSARKVWPTYDTGPDDHVHALGVVSVNYNNLEWVLLLFHLFYSGAPHPVATRVFERASNDFRLELLKTIATTSIKDDDIRENAVYFAKGFQICASNRNILLHSQLLSRRGRDNIFPASKRTKGGRLSSYDFRLEDIRRVADEIYEWYMFGNLTVTYAFWSQRPGKRDIRPTLPQKPTLPANLEVKLPADQ